MSGFRPSEATPDDVELYTSGECHVLAVAIHRRTGWPMHVVLDQDERWWEDPEDDDNWIPAVAHVYCVDPDGNAWDIEGVRPLSEVPSLASERFGVRDYDSDEVRSEEGLKPYIGCWGDDGEEIDRPLCEYGDADVDDAWEAACRALGHLPGFPAASPASASRP